jgi:uncharacterized protein YprB with RNaseH-like and TPR domain
MNGRPEDFRVALARLVRAAAAGDAPNAGAARRRPSPAPGRREEGADGRGGCAVEERLAGRVVEGGGSRCFLHERWRSSIEPASVEARRFGDAPSRLGLRLDRAVVLDLETTGLSSTPIFLAGCLVPRGDDFLVAQYFARDYSEEKGLVAAVGALIADAEVLITYNGKSYDWPLLRDRAALHGRILAEPPLHLDLLHHARRRYREILPDCRLKTVEWHVLRRHRYQDVDGADIPRLYHDYVRSGDFEPLLPVFHHNIFDLLTLCSLVAELVLREPEDAEEERSAETGRPVARAAEWDPGFELGRERGRNADSDAQNPPRGPAHRIPGGTG